MTSAYRSVMLELCIAQNDFCLCIDLSCLSSAEESTTSVCPQICHARALEDSMTSVCLEICNV